MSKVNKKDSLGDRMKRYESVTKNFLTRRVPAIIRLDGKAFHTFTRGMNKPFDKIFMKTMQDTMRYLCENIQGCVFGYTQSDEITLVLTDYETITTDAWFGYNIQKMTSISASMATLAFNNFLSKNINVWMKENNMYTMKCFNDDKGGELNRLYDVYWGAFNKGALFDSRTFSIPKEEVCNCLIWRQQDATRNSIQSVGQANFSQRQLQGKSCNQIQDMLFVEKGINWNDFPTDCKRGSCCYKRKVEKEITIPKNGEKNTVNRSEWYIDKDIPIFTKNREYVEKCL